MALVAVNAEEENYIPKVMVTGLPSLRSVYPYTYGYPYAYRTLGLPIVPETVLAPPALPVVSAPVVVPSPYYAASTLLTAPAIPAVKYIDYVNPAPFVELKSIVAPKPIEFKSVAAPKPIEEPSTPEPAMPEMPAVEE